MIYIIHIGDRGQDVTHTIGYCADERLRDRLMEHARRKGSRATRKAIETGRSMYLGRTLHGLTQFHEKKLRGTSRVIDLCQLCCPLTDPIDRTPMMIVPSEPPIIPQWDPIDWRREQQQKRFPPNRKGPNP